MPRYDLTDFELSEIAPIPPQTSRGVPRVDDRKVLNGIFWGLHSAAPWAHLSRHYGPHTTCYNRFHQWTKAGDSNNKWTLLQRFMTGAFG